MGTPTINGGVLQTMKVAGRIPEVGRKPCSPSGITLWEALQLLIGNGAHEPQEPKGFFEKIQFLEKKGCGGSPKSSSSSKQRDVSWVPKSRRLLFFGRFQSSIPPWRIFGSLENTSTAAPDEPKIMENTRFSYHFGWQNHEFLVTFPHETKTYHQHRPMGKIKVFWQNPGFKLCDPYSEWDHRKPGFGISSRPVWGQWLHQEAILADPMLGWDLSVSLILY
jgi:hypothetical protein